MPPSTHNHNLLRPKFFPVVSAHVGSHHDPNYLHRRSMEDEMAVECYQAVPGLFVAVFDGHGGKLASTLLRQLLHRFFLSELLGEPTVVTPTHHSPSISENKPLRLPVTLPQPPSPPLLPPAPASQLRRSPSSVKHPLPFHQLDVCSAFTRSYAKMDAMLRVRNCTRVGATAVTCFIRTDPTLGTILTTANCGDSRAVLCRAAHPYRLSEDHRPVHDVERQRIQNAGGFVAWARVNGVLNVSRAFGDHCMKSVVVSTPSVSEVVLDDSDRFVVLACDGLWDFVSEKSVIQTASRCFDEGMNADEVARVLVKEAIHHNSTDNVSVMVVLFDHAHDEGGQ
ncbi:phosphatase 2C 71 [Gracilariopsis chorda]|uniref:Phosphatase 2C 71 n=1 Tax=Gracilariopsis chorda TaxID=448386 RepID=A0A2V3IMI3_9FLOR|nr:phosphatase 2C 71 [Gracilariopsis chorda]|eukprot:PXF43294.1 phosphatase 2C 71 [Gracilariopsis chorda]